MKKPTIVVNTRMLLKDQLDGTGWFAYHTLKRITRAHPEVGFVFLFDRKFSKEFIFSNNILPMVIWPPTRHPFLYYLWFQIRVKSLLKKLKPDLFLSLDGILPLGAPCKQLAVIHDINFKHHPKDLPFWYAKYFNYYFPRAAQEAVRIAAVSEYTKQDIVKTYHIDPSKIDVVYNGVDEGFSPVSTEIKEQVRKKFTQGKNYFIFVGSVHPRKNIIRLLEAFELFKKESASELKLVIAGALFWGKTEIDQALQKMNFKKDVILTGRISDTDIKQLTGSAFALTYIPYFEGFGVPLIEAMRSGIPIISANTTSLPEVAGEAALYVDPFNVTEIKEAMQTMYSNEQIRNTLVQKGTVQCQKFSWDVSAKKLWACIEQTLNPSTSSAQS